MRSGEGGVGAGAESGTGTTDPWWRRVDPEGRAWRNATRGVVMAVPLFAVYAALDLVVWSPWAFIGLLNTLLPDIGGPLRPRLRTGVEILVGSAAMAFLGALVADQPVALVAAMFVVAFAAAYIGVLSPYLAAAGTSLLLVFLLSGGSPTHEVSAAGWRAANVAVGAALAVVALVALFPAPRRRRVEPSLAAACRAVADLLEPSPPTDERGSERELGPDEVEVRARTAMATVVHVTTTQRWPPLSRSAVDRARLAFTHDLQSLFARAVALHRADRLGHSPPEGDDPRRAGAAGLRALGAWLLDEGPGPDGAALRAAADRAAGLELELRDEAACSVGDPGALDRFRIGRRLAAACLLTSVLADGVAAAAFHTEQPQPPARRGLVDVTGHDPSYLRRLALNLSPDSLVFRHAVRLATACAVAVAVEQALDLFHGYWAVLTVVVTLRTSRGASASRSVERLLGTVGGVVVASVSIALAQLSEARTAVIMGLTVVTLFATLWTGSAHLRWAWGVTSITACVLTMFQLLTPGDWDLESARLEATVLGLAIALAVAFLLWPGSSLVALRAALAGGAEALSTLVDALRAVTLGEPPTTGLDAARRNAARHLTQARSTLGAASREGVVGEGSTLPVAVLELEQAAELVRRVDDALVGAFRTPPAASAAGLLDDTARATERGLAAVADAFTPVPGPVTPGDGGRPPDLPAPADRVAAQRWRGLSPGDVVEPQVLDALADLGTVGHRAADLVSLGRTGA